MLCIHGLTNLRLETRSNMAAVHETSYDFNSYMCAFLADMPAVAAAG